MISHTQIFRILIIWLVTLAGILLPSPLVFGQFNEKPFFEDIPRISISDLQNEDQVIFLTDNWKVFNQDSIAFARTDYDDRHWEEFSTQLGTSVLAFMEWNGIGWFRKKIEVDSSLVGEPLALIFTRHNGASEVYLDGHKIETIGTPSTDQTSTRPEIAYWPRYLQFSEPGIHQLAVRFVNHNASLFNHLGFFAGFRLLIGSFPKHIQQTRQEVVTSSAMKMFIIGSLISFTVIHFLFYLFYPAEPKNLYFALFTGVLALLTFSSYQISFADSPLTVISFFRVSIVTWLVSVLVALRFAYSLYYERLPRYFWLFLTVGIALIIVTWFRHQWTGLYREIFVLVTLVEILRVLGLNFQKRQEGAWVISAGLSLFVGGIIYAVAANIQLVDGHAVTGNFVGSLSFILAMSVYLSRNFASTNKKLKYKLQEVKYLSERSLQQERENKKKELERRLLEAENERKSRELEEARTLQLSMLPKTIPQSDYWDMAVHMETAYEVGGDYYDFSQASDGTLTIALGDATGHGMKAGIMVATAKSYFHTLADQKDEIDILRQMSHGIKNMDVKTMFMSFSILKCNGRSVTMSVAGMPPALLYHKNEQRIERILIRGMPLGTRVDYPYERVVLNMQPGDVLLAMSDGIVELFNPKRTMLDIERIEKTFKETAQLPAGDIILSLKKRAVEWLEGNEPDDDITMLVLKAR